MVDSCGCRYELPAWHALAEELEPLGLDLVAVALGDEERVRHWTGKAGLPPVLDPGHRLSDVFGVVNVPSTVWLDEDVRRTRAERRLAAWLHREGRDHAARRHFDAAVTLAPLACSIRSSMRNRGEDPFGEEFFELWDEWSKGRSIGLPADVTHTPSLTFASRACEAPSMAFTVEFTSGTTTEFDDRARYSIDGSGALHITTPDERTIYAAHAWVRIAEQHDPRQPSTRFV